MRALNLLSALVDERAVGAYVLTRTPVVAVNIASEFLFFVCCTGSGGGRGLGLGRASVSYAFPTISLDGRYPLCNADSFAVTHLRV